MTPDSVIRDLLRLLARPWIRIWGRLSRGRRRLIKVLGIVAVLVVTPVGLAHADGDDSPGALDWMPGVDRYGNGIFDYRLSLDRGGATSPGKSMWSFFVDMQWELYRAWVALACWLLDWTLSFSWLSWVLEPVEDIASSLQTVVDNVGLIPTFLMVTGLAGLLFAVKGKVTTGVYEVVISLVIAGLAVGILANPLDKIAGPDGMLPKSRDFGLQLALALSGDPDAMGVESCNTAPAQDWKDIYTTPLEGGCGPAETPPDNDAGAGEEPAEEESQGTVYLWWPDSTPSQEPSGSWQAQSGMTCDEMPAGDIAECSNNGPPTKAPASWCETVESTGQSSPQCTAAGEEPAPELATPDSDEMSDGLVGMLIETFIRKPHQVVNFGEVLDGGDCESAYRVGMQEMSGNSDALREAVKECDESAGQVAENPNSTMFINMGALYPTAFVVLLFVIILCFVVLMACVYAIYQGVKMIIALVIAVLPGSARGMLWMTFADLLMSLVTVVFSVVFLAIYLLFIQGVLARDGNPLATFFIVDMLLFIGIVLFLTVRGRIKAAAARMAAMMAKRPGDGAATPSQMPQQGSKLSLASDAAHIGHIGSRLMRKLTFSPSRPSPAPGEKESSTDSSPSRRKADSAPLYPPRGGNGPDPSSGRPSPTGRPPKPDADAARRVKERVQKIDTTSKRTKQVTQVARMGAKVGGAVLTSGGSLSMEAAKVVGKQAGKDAAIRVSTKAAARRRELRSRLRAAQVATTPTTRQPHLGRPAPRPTQQEPRPASDSAVARRLQERLNKARR